jgi:putative sigma-54 modulation protein
MRIDITGRHVDVTPALRQLVERRLSRVERLLNDSAVSATAILTLEKYRHRTEIIVHARGDKMLRGLGEGNAWNLSIRQAMEKVEQQAKKVKGKWTERKRSDTRRRTPRAAGADGTGRGARAEAPEREPAAPPRVIRSARYAVKPMSVEDAALRMEQTTEAFLVFRNPDSESVSIVYRRKDGNLGLIEPD